MREEIIVGILTLFSILTTAVFAHDEIVDFESDQWIIRNGQITEHLGRKSFVGYAYLKDIEFENGIIEVDIAVTGHKVRAYPGIVFRMQSEENFERFYIRSHRASLYPDALQYTPVSNGITSWQLYNGEGFTAAVDFPPNQWLHIKMEILGQQARVYVNDIEKPALVIHELKTGQRKGTIGLMAEGTAYFSNFKYEITDDLDFDPPPLVDTVPGIMTEWRISQPFKLSDVDLEQYPDKKFLSQIKWQEVSGEPSGLIDIARYTGRLGRQPDCILARTTVITDKKRILDFRFGYSDAVSIFLNGEAYFIGNSAYQSRDPSFAGIIGFFDDLYLPLKKGENEILLLVAEAFGGWGFMAQDGDAVFEYEGVEKAWESTMGFQIPESVVYDSVRGMLYVSNYDVYNFNRREGQQSISRVSMDGKIKNADWVAGLKNPLGMIIHEDRLLVVERGGVVEIDLESGNIKKRHPIPQSGLLNDIAIDSKENIYVSDSRKNVIYRVFDDQSEEWLIGEDVNDPNAMLVQGNMLIFGNSGDYCLKSVDLATKEVRKIANLGPGFIDGIKINKDGNYLVSHWQGRVFRITPSGDVTKILDLSVPGIYCADFEYITDRDLLIIPTFFDNRVMAYNLGEK